MYARSAALFDLLYANVKDYRAEVVRLVRLIDELHGNARSVLDVACGTARHLELLKERFDVEGIDLSAELLEVARARVPGVPLHLADMRDFRLDRSFDVVTCLFGSVGYLLTVDDLFRAVATMASHLKEDGLLIIEPWLSPEQFWDGHMVHNFYRSNDSAVSQMYVQHRQGRRSWWDKHYLVARRSGDVEHFIEHEEMGLFEAGEYSNSLKASGLDVIEHPSGLHGYGLLLARRKAWSPTERELALDILDQSSAPPTVAG